MRLWGFLYWVQRILKTLQLEHNRPMKLYRCKKVWPGQVRRTKKINFRTLKNKCLDLQLFDQSNDHWRCHFAPETKAKKRIQKWEKQSLSSIGYNDYHKIVKLKWNLVDLPHCIRVWKFKFHIKQLLQYEIVITR